MTTQHTQDRADADLRALLAQVDPEAGAPSAAPAHLLERVQAEVAADPVGRPMPAAGSPHPLAGAGDDEPLPAAAAPPAKFTPKRPGWQPWLLAAAGITSLALAAGTILPNLATGSSDSASLDESSAAGSVAGSGSDAATDGAAAAPEFDREAADTGLVAESDMAVGTPEGTKTQDEAENTLVRSASLLVGTDAVQSARDSFVANVLSKGGRVTSETVVTDDASGGVTAQYDMGMTTDMMYPWYPTGPGIWLTVEVPASDYDATVQAARGLGEVVQMQQSSYDVGAQKTDVDTRITALEASLERLTALMDDAEDIDDVIALEQAIAQRQSELDSLRAQQRELANQTAMSQISLTLMNADDAKQTVDPQPYQSWWEKFLDGLSDLWAWLGKALLIVSPLVLAWAAIVLWRRRQRRYAAAAPAAPATAAEPAEAPPAAG